MNAADIMTTTVLTVTPETTVLDCAKLFLDNHISAAPVLDATGNLVGIISEGDLILRAEIGTDQTSRSWWLKMFTRTETTANEYVKTHSNRVADLMSKSVISVKPDTSVGELAHLLERKRIKRVPVVDGGRLVGIVSRANLLHALASQKEKAPATSSTDDRSIRQAMIKEMKSANLRNALPSNVTATDGVLEIWGIAYSEEERTAARVAAESIAGVKEFVDHRTLDTNLRYDF